MPRAGVSRDVVERVGERGGREAAAASAGVHGGQSRVFTRPATGDFAMTISVGVHRSTRAMSRTVRAVPPIVPVTFDRPIRGA